MKKITLLLAILFVAISASSQTTWVHDPYHSHLGFTVTHLGIADVPGNFSDYEVTITASEADFSDAVIELTVQTESVDTRVTPRDNHLRSADFFDVEQHPTMTFKSTSIKRVGENRYTLTGDLTLVGVTRQVAMEMEYRGTTDNPNADGAPVAGIQISGEINRSDFGMGADFPPPMISDKVVIKADGEFGHKN